MKNLKLICTHFLLQTHLICCFTSEVLVVGHQEGHEGGEAHPPLLGDLPLLQHVVVGEGRQRRARHQAHHVVLRVHHAQDAHAAEVRVAVHLVEYRLVTCNITTTN